MKTVFCECQGKRIDDWGECDGCVDDSWLYEEQNYEESPLYRSGQLENMSPEQLITERDRQYLLHDVAIDRCEEINSPTIETAAARVRLIQRELERRGLNPHADTPTPSLSSNKRGTD